MCPTGSTLQITRRDCRPRWTISPLTLNAERRLPRSHGARRYGDHPCRSDGRSDLRSPTAASRDYTGPHRDPLMTRRSRPRTNARVRTSSGQVLAWDDRRGHGRRGPERPVYGSKCSRRGSRRARSPGRPEREPSRRRRGIPLRVGRRSGAGGDTSRYLPGRGNSRSRVEPGRHARPRPCVRNCAASARGTESRSQSAGRRRAGCRRPTAACSAAGRPRSVLSRRRRRDSAPSARRTGRADRPAPRALLGPPVDHDAADRVTGQGDRRTRIAAVGDV